MAISDSERSEIWRLHSVDGLPVGTIARLLGRHHSTVSRAIASRGGRPKAKIRKRASKLDAYVDLIVETLKNYPDMPASRMYQIAAKHGYAGSEASMRRKVAELRPRKSSEAFLRLSVLPGEQAQVDWAEFGAIAFGSARRKLYCFVMTLSYSRMRYVEFFPGSSMEHFLRGHAGAFEAFGGVPRNIVCDNLKSAAAGRCGKAIELNATAMEMLDHYGTWFKPAGVRRGNEKGRVERSIRYVRQNFWPAREWRDLDDLNAQARDWCETVSAGRPCPGDKRRTVREAFEAERGHLRALPDAPFPVEDVKPVKVGKTPYVRYDANDYSVPHKLVGRTLTVAAGRRRLRVIDGDEVVATHRRSFDKGAQIEDPRHIDALIKRKREAGVHRGQNRLIHAVPAVESMLVDAVKRRYSLGPIVADLLRLLDSYGADELAAAVARARESDSPHPNTVRLHLAARRRERGDPPPVPLDLPDVPVRGHDLSQYDSKAKRTEP